MELVADPNIALVLCLALFCHTVYSGHVPEHVRTVCCGTIKPILPRNFNSGERDGLEEDA
jgi:hypothetical protein